MHSPSEIWLPVVGWENYEVSNYGQVRSLNKIVNSKNKSKALKKGKILKAATKGNGYKQVVLCGNAGKSNMLVHRLVGIAFIPNPNNYPQINHLKGNKQDNRSWMLEWSTSSMNLKHSFRKLNRLPSKPGLGKVGKLNSRSIPVLQYDLGGSLIERHDSITYASNKTGVKLSEIAACMSDPRRLTAKGFKWVKA